VRDGAKEVKGADVSMYRVPENAPGRGSKKMVPLRPRKFCPCTGLCGGRPASADAIIFGTPTRYGNMCGQMRQFLDATEDSGPEKPLVGKVGSVFAVSATQHGGTGIDYSQFPYKLLHHGMIVVGLPYTFEGQMRIDEITGGSLMGLPPLLIQRRTPAQRK